MMGRRYFLSDTNIKCFVTNLSLVITKKPQHYRGFFSVENVSFLSAFINRITALLLSVLATLAL